MCSSSYNEKLELLNQNIKTSIEDQDLKPRSDVENGNKDISLTHSPTSNVRLSAGDTNLHKDVENFLINGIVNPSDTTETNGIKIIDYFQMRISNICLKLINIEKSIQEIGGKLNNLCLAQDNSSKIKFQFQETLNAYNHDISKLENEHSKQLLDFEENLSQELNRIENFYQKKNDEFKNNYEKKLHDLVKGYEERLNIQNIEIERLNSIIEDEFHRLRNEVKKLQSFSKQNEPQKLDLLKRKMEKLRKCLAKKEQEYIMSEKAYAKRLSTLVQQHEFREKNLQIQLAAQRVELTYHKDIPDDQDSFLQDVEIRYQKLLMGQRNVFIEQHKRDLKTIAELTQQLRFYKYKTSDI